MAVMCSKVCGDLKKSKFNVIDPRENTFEMIVQHKRHEEFRNEMNV